MNRGQNARFGLRGCRIGEASNPGPLKKALRRLPSCRVSQHWRSRSRGELIELSSDDGSVIPPTRMGGEQFPVRSLQNSGRQMPSFHLAPAHRSSRAFKVHTNSLCVEKIRMRLARPISHQVFWTVSNRIWKTSRPASILLKLHPKKAVPLANRERVIAFTGHVREQGLESVATG